MKIIDLDWTYENGVYSLKNEASKDDVIITGDCLVYGYPNYDEEKRQKTHYFLCPPVPGPHHKLRIIKGVIHFSSGWGNLRIIGKNIKLIRKKFQLTQKELAKVINTSQSTISSYEKGKTLVLTVFIYNLALNFNLSVDKICDRNKELVKI